MRQIRHADIQGKNKEKPSLFLHAVIMSSIHPLGAFFWGVSYKNQQFHFTESRMAVLLESKGRNAASAAATASCRTTRSAATPLAIKSAARASKGLNIRDPNSPRGAGTSMLMVEIKFAIASKVRLSPEVICYRRRLSESSNRSTALVIINKDDNPYTYSA
jgi:hypothetical protein